MGQLRRHHLHPRHGLLELVGVRERDGVEYVVCATTTGEGLENAMTLMVPREHFHAAMKDRPSEADAQRGMDILDGKVDVDDDPLDGKTWRGQLATIESALESGTVATMAAVWVSMSAMDIRATSILAAGRRLRSALAGSLVVALDCTFDAAVLALESATTDDELQPAA